MGPAVKVSYLAYSRNVVLTFHCVVRKTKHPPKQMMTCNVLCTSSLSI